jgi:hypothetical protein
VKITPGLEIATNPAELIAKFAALLSGMARWNYRGL